MALTLAAETASKASLSVFSPISFWAFWWMTPVVIARVVLERMCPSECITVVRDDRVYYPACFRSIP